ncbi:MAG: RIP metalloprotease RseP [Patescibacteria group bacterium]
MLLTFITFIIVFSVVIFVHEFGHFMAGRKMGVKVEEFGFGYPPRLKAIKKKGTEYSLNWIPFGGFVKLKGLEEGSREVKEKDLEKDSFSGKKIWQRALILSAGVLMNFLLTFFLVTLGYIIGLPSAIDENTTGKIRNEQIQVYEVLENSPAELAGLKTGDAIIAIDEQKFTKINDLQAYEADKIDQTLELTVKRGNELTAISVKPQVMDETKQGKLGVSLVETALVSYPVHIALYKGLVTTGSLISQIVYGIYDIIKTAIISHHVSTDIAGPVGIAVISGQVAKMGFIYILQFVAILSTSLAIMNFLPLPALDGGRLLFLFIEKIRGKPVNQRIENLVHTFGFYLLFLLLIVVSFRDLQRFNIFQSLYNYIKNIFV